MHRPKKICLSCRRFSLQDPASGVCKLEQGVTPYPLKAIEDTCEQWKDCGQQYFIRTGWIKARLAKDSGAERATGTGIIH